MTHQLLAPTRIALLLPALLLATAFSCGGGDDDQDASVIEDPNDAGNADADSATSILNDGAQGVVISDCLAGVIRVETLADYEAVLPYQCISGTLRIEMENGGELSFPNLQQVGTLAIAGIESGTTPPRFDALQEADTIAFQYNASITNVDVFPSLTVINEELTVTENDSLVSLAGLAGLESFNGTLEIEDNAALESLGFLTNATLDIHYLYIKENPALTSLQELSGLTETGASIEIQDNDSLTSLAGLENVRTVGIQVDVRDNDSLTDVSALWGIEEIQTALTLEDNALTSVEGFAALTSVRGIVISEPAVETISGFSSLQTIRSQLEVYDCDVLRSLSGFALLTEVGGEIEIYDNPQLATVDGLARVTSAGSVYIGTSFYRHNNNLDAPGNAVLATLSLDALTDAGSTFVALGNPALSSCSLCSILSGLSSEPGTIELQGNQADTCGDVIASTADCS